MVKYAVSEKDKAAASMPDQLVDETVKGIIAQAQSYTKHKLKASQVEDIIVLRYPRGSKNVRFCLLTRMKPADPQSKLDYLNELRAAKGKVPLSNWFSGEAALSQAIEFEQGKRKSINTAEEILAIMAGKIPPIEVLKPGVARGAYRNREEAKRATGKAQRKWPPRVEPDVSKSPTGRLNVKGPELQNIKHVSAASVLEELGIEGRKGRALLRKHNISRTDPDAIRAFFKERK